MLVTSLLAKAYRPVLLGQSGQLPVRACLSPPSRLHSTSTSNPTLIRPLRFNVGVAYAGKNSPPFSTVEEAEEGSKAGFDGKTKIGRWKNEQLLLASGRNELFAQGNDGESYSAEQRRRWGAGEDSFFVKSEGDSKTHLSVSDGVGGWIRNGIDSSLFSQSLMFYAHQFVTKQPSPKGGVKQILEKAYEGTMNDSAVAGGSATACMISLDSSTGLLESINLGDSGYCIIRNDEIIYASTVQTHFFNCPTQLAKQPPGFPGLGDTVDVGDVAQMPVKVGDMIMLFTDGLSDNVHPAQYLSLLEHVNQTLQHPENSFLLPSERNLERAKLFADVCVGYARMIMGRQDVVTPMEKEAAVHDLAFKGGKIDDVTVITAYVTEAE